MGGGSSNRKSSSSSASVPAVHRFGVGTAGAAEAAYPVVSSIDPNALLYTKNSKPYGKQVGGMHVVGLQYAIRNLQFQVLNLNIGRAFQYFTDVVCSLAMHNLGAFRGQHCRAGRGRRGKCKFITVCRR